MRVRDLTIEYSSGGYTVRPIDELDLDIGDGRARAAARRERMRQDDPALDHGIAPAPTAGTIDVGGVEVTGLSGAALTDYRRHTVGVVFQAFNLIPSLTAIENVIVTLRGAGVHATAATARARRGARTGRPRRPRRPPARRPVRRTAAARRDRRVRSALDPPVILADEPTAHLDYVQVDSVIRLLRDLAGSRPDRGRRDPRRAAAPARRPGGGAHATSGGRHASLRVASSSPRPRSCSGRATWATSSTWSTTGAIEIVGERADGGEDLIRTIPAPGYFGELAPMFGLRRSATARAADRPTVVTGMGLREFRARTEAGASRETRCDESRPVDEAAVRRRGREPPVHCGPCGRFGGACSSACSRSS